VRRHVVCDASEDLESLATTPALAMSVACFPISTRPGSAPPCFVQLKLAPSAVAFCIVASAFAIPGKVLVAMSPGFRS